MNKYIKNLLIGVLSAGGIVMAALTLPGCFENGGGAGGQVYVGPTTTGCLSTGDPAGGYIRTDSIDAGECGAPGSFSVGVYTQYTNYPIGGSLAVCSTEDTSNTSPIQAAGWTPMGLPERDALGCDNQTSTFRTDPNYRNVVWMKRLSKP